MANDTAKRLLARIRELRLAFGLTQEVFAEKAGLTYKHYQQVEAGRRPDIRLSTLIKIANAFGLEPRELFNFEAEPAALAEDAAKYGGGTAAGKDARKAVKRRSNARG